jgi:hypothetical protein
LEGNKTGDFYAPKLVKVIPLPLYDDSVMHDWKDGNVFVKGECVLMSSNRAEPMRIYQRFLIGQCQEMLSDKEILKDLENTINHGLKSTTQSQLQTTIFLLHVAEKGAVCTDE